ncbi:MAG: hypothetical protein PUK76_10950 [Treponema sp.]|nr:hypothetical protein [Treponema sp.]
MQFKTDVAVKLRHCLTACYVDAPLVHVKMKMVENMKNRKSFIGIVSIILPPLALFLGLPVLIKFSEKIYFDDFFSKFRLKLLYWGWIVGLIAGVKGLKETSMSRNEGIVRIILKCVSILGIVINCFWMLFMVIAFIQVIRLC